MVTLLAAWLFSAPSKVEQLLDHYAPVAVVADLTTLPPAERKAALLLIQAAETLGALQVQQAYSGPIPTDANERELFRLNGGPWSFFDERKPFVAGVAPYSGGGNLYPADATKQQVLAWIETLTPAQKAEAVSPLTVIRRDAAGKLQSVPYATAFKLGATAELLRSAAAVTQDKALATYLRAQAQALESNDYASAATPWHAQRGPLIASFFPAYTDFTDLWVGSKRSLGAWVGLANHDGDRAYGKLLTSAFARDVAGLDPEQLRVLRKRSFKVQLIDVLIATGWAAIPYHALCDGSSDFPMPSNEPPVIHLFSNILEYKFDEIMQEIANHALLPADATQFKAADFTLFFAFNMLISAVQQPNAALRELQFTYASALQHVQAALMLQSLPAKERAGHRLLTTSVLRSARFGKATAQGGGSHAVLGAQLASGGLRLESGKLVIDDAKFQATELALSAKIRSLKSYEEGRAYIDSLSTESISKLLTGLNEVPVDLDAVYSH